ncbi:MAG: ABC transporter permease, partial [Anaerolineales bacterium]
MALKNLWRRKIRTFLTMLGIAVGVAGVVTLGAFGEGMASGFERIFSTSSADLTIGQRDAMMLMLSAVDIQVGEEISRMEGVDQVAGKIVDIVQMDESPYFIVTGEDTRGFAIEHYHLIAGSPLTRRKQILLGSITAENFDKRVGEAFRMDDITYRVAGIYETGVSLEDGGAVISLEDAQTLFDKRGQVSYFVVKLSDPRRVKDLEADIEARWPELAAIRSGEATQQDDMIAMYRSFGLFLGIFAVLVGGLGMMNTMLMSVLERTREIGVLRALGWKRRRIITMIIGEALIVALGGGALGILLGVGLTELARTAPSVEALLQDTLTPYILAQAIGIAVVLGTVGGLYPAWRASKLQPVEAMRYEAGAGDLGRFAQWLVRMFGRGALRNLWRRPGRTFVTVTGIGIGVGFIVALIAMVDGFSIIFTQMASAGQADLMAEEANVSDMSLSEIDDRVSERLRGDPEVEAVSRILMGISSAPGIPFFIVYGLDQHEDFIQHYRIQEGRTIQRPGEIVLGRFAANGLEKVVGDTLRVSGERFNVVGIYENGSVFEDAGGMVLLRDAQSLFGKPHKASLLAIRVTDSERADEIAARLEAQFPQLLIAKASAFTERLQDFKTTDAMLNSLVVLTLIVGGIVTMNAMLMTVFERTQEIGVLRALGWKKRRILRMVLAESIALSALAGVAGVAIGFG